MRKPQVFKKDSSPPPIECSPKLGNFVGEKKPPRFGLLFWTVPLKKILAEILSVSPKHPGYHVLVGFEQL